MDDIYRLCSSLIDFGHGSSWVSVLAVHYALPVLEEDRMDRGYRTATPNPFSGSTLFRPLALFIHCSLLFVNQTTLYTSHPIPQHYTEQPEPEHTNNYSSDHQSHALPTTPHSKPEPKLGPESELDATLNSTYPPHRTYNAPICRPGN
jgi:hypothetical protein